MLHASDSAPMRLARKWISLFFFYKSSNFSTGNVCSYNV